MNLNNPIIIDNQIYDKAIINLAISTNYTNGVEDLSMAIRIVPTKIDSNGSMIINEANSIGIFRGHINELSSDNETNLINNLLINLQNLLNEKI